MSTQSRSIITDDGPDTDARWGDSHSVHICPVRLRDERIDWERVFGIVFFWAFLPVTLWILIVTMGLALIEAWS